MKIECFGNFFRSLTDCFTPNEYMDKYMALLETCADNTEGEKHHAVPVCYYGQKYKCRGRKAAEKLANADSNNLIIQLSISQHILAHFYLCKCCTDKILFERLLNAFKLLFNTRDNLDMDMLDETAVLEQVELIQQKRQKDCFGKSVLCIETNTVYPNVSAANEAMGKSRYGYLGIYNTCTNKDGQQSALGYHWCFYEEGSEIPEHLAAYLGSGQKVKYVREGKSIYCVETGEIFKSAYEAGKRFGVTRGTILRCCEKSWLTVNDLHMCYVIDKDTFIPKTKPHMSEEARKNISVGTTKAMAKLPESKKRQMREKNKQYWAENKLHYYNNGIEEARLPECPEGWVLGRLGKYRTKGKPVKCIELNSTYENAAVAAAALKINRKGISNCLNGKAKTAGGYTWQFV